MLKGSVNAAQLFRLYKGGFVAVCCCIASRNLKSPLDSLPPSTMRLRLPRLLLAVGALSSLTLASFHDRTPLQNRRHSHARALVRKHDHGAHSPVHQAREDPADRSNRPAATDIFLRPAIDPNHNLSDYDNLVPAYNHTLYYSSQHRKVWTSFRFKNKTVALDHSIFVVDVSCSKGSTEITLTLKDYRSFRIVQAWEQDLPIFLTGYRFKGCFPADERADRFWAQALVGSMRHSGGFSFVITIRMMPTTEVAHDVEINIGHPDGINKAPDDSPQGSSQPAGSSSSGGPSPGPGGPPPGPGGPPLGPGGPPPGPGGPPSGPGGPPPGPGGPPPDSFSPGSNQGSPPGGAPPGPGNNNPGNNNNNGGGSNVAQSPPPQSQGPNPVVSSPANVPTVAPSPGDATLDGDFDIRLDEMIGYWLEFERAFYNQVFPGMNVSDEEIEENDSAPSRRDLERRFSLKSLVKSVVHAAVAVVVTVAKAAVQVVQQVAAVVVQAVKVVVAVVAAVIPPITLTPINTDWSFSVPPSGFLPTQESVFGDGFLIYNKTQEDEETGKEIGVSAYCVGCKLSGDLHVLGTLHYTFPTFITAATLQLKGPMNLYAEVGLVLFEKLEGTFEHDIIKVPIAALSIDIPGIISFGPEIVFTMKAALSYETSGFLGLGLNATWSDAFSITLNFLNPLASTSSNLAPSVVPIFQIGASISVTIEITAEAGLELGLDLFDGKIKLDAGIYYEDGYKAQLIDGFEFGSNPQLANGCNGLSICLERDKQAYLSAPAVSYAFYQTSSIIKSWCETDAPTSTANQAPSLTAPSIAPPVVTQGPLPMCNFNGTTASTYTAPDQSVYQIQCNSDRFGSDISNGNAPLTFQTCMDACSLWTSNNPNLPCLAIAWVPARIPEGTQCNLKNPLPPSSAAPSGLEVDSAVVSLLAASCPADNGGFYTSYVDSVSYQIVCDMDYPGYDIRAPATGVVNLRSCIDQCSSYNQNPSGAPCVGVSYVYTGAGNQLYCYLKSNVPGPPRPSNGLWSAQRPCKAFAFDTPSPSLQS
ncbi:hypothetical protein B0H11DRAFT_880142 [Mycena galericulata]|nr:hypothetical protein B0H11DRAFT_880142 [Mycena galericulata]